MAFKQLMIGGGVSAKSMSVDRFFEYMRDIADDDHSPSSMYRAVSWAFRCVNLRANAISSIPFRIVRGETEIKDFEIDLGDLLFATEAFICMYGAAYWLKLNNRVILKDIQVLNPKTMSVNTAPRKGIVGFTQRIKGVDTHFKPEEIVYFRLFNPDDDLGPGVSPMSAAMHAAGLAYSVNEWAGKFFAQGAIPAVILSSEQNIPETDRSRIRDLWNRALGGVKNAFRTIVLHRGLKAQVIGMPVKDLAMPQLTKMVREEIAISFGVPESMVGDPASNYATAKTNRLSFWQETVIPEARILERFINRQLFEPLGLTFEFEFGKIEAVQQDEAEKAEFVVKLFESKIMTIEEARDQMGLRELTPAELEELKPKPPPMLPAPPDDDQQNSEPEPPGNEKTLAALRKWRTKARKRGKPCEFDSEHIADDLAGAVKTAMEQDIDSAFDFLKAVPEGVTAAEGRVQRRVASAMEPYQSSIAATIAAGQSIDWAKINGDLRAAIQPEISRIATEHAMRTAAEIGVEFDIAVINEAALAWANEYTMELVKGLTETTRAVVQRAIDAFIATPGMTTGDLTGLLEPAFGRIRAEMIGITEVTRAYSAATNVYKKLLAEAGLNSERIWNTSADEKVCPICGPLDGQPEREWADMFPSGPPAHPRCRCWSTLNVLV